jgi:sugar lactone lactonase YvrE
MAEVFNCPSCSAPLETDGTRLIITCPNCDESVIVPEPLRPARAAPPASTINVGHSLAGRVQPAPARNEWGMALGIILVMVVGIPALLVALNWNQVFPPPRPLPLTATALPIPTPTATPFAAVLWTVSDLDDAQGLGLDGSGVVYIAEGAADRVRKWDAQGVAAGGWPLGGSDPLVYFAGDGAGTLYAVRQTPDSGAMIQKYVAISGQAQNDITWPTVPYSLAARPDGRFMIAAGDVITLWDGRGQTTTQIPRPALTLDRSTLSGLAFAPTASGALYAVATANATVLRFTAQGQLLGSFGPTGAGPRSADGTIAVDQWERVYMGAGSVVRVYAATGPYLGSITLPPAQATGTLRQLVYQGPDILYALSEKAAIKLRLLPPVPEATPTPAGQGIGEAVTVAGWQIALTALQSRAALIPADQEPALTPDGLYYVLWLDARNTATVPHALDADFGWELLDSTGTRHPNRLAAAAVNSRGVRQFLATMQRAGLDAPVAAGADTHALLAFDLPPAAVPVQLLLTHKPTGTLTRFDLR